MCACVTQALLGPNTNMTYTGNHIELAVHVAVHVINDIQARVTFLISNNALIYDDPRQLVHRAQNGKGIRRLSWRSVRRNVWVAELG
jgi:hypothetical protein